MSYTRLIIGILTVFLALWIIIGEQMSGASANAVVNAQAVTLRAPVAGELQLEARQLGSKVSEGEVMARLEDVLVDRVRLNDLSMELDVARASLTQLGAQLNRLQRVRRDVLKRNETFARQRMLELRTRLSYAEDRLALIEEAENLEGADLQSLDAVEEGGNRLPSEALSKPLLLSHARERVETLKIILRSAEQGVFLGEGYNDTPNSAQRARELGTEIAVLETRMAEKQADVDIIQERFNRERISVNALAGGEIQSPVTGIFWEILQSDGVNVQRGDPVVRLVDCGSVVVTLSVTERVYNRLEIGQATKFRLSGTSTIYDATVSRLAGSGAATIYRNLVVAPSQKHLERYDVTLLVPGLRQDTGSTCHVGRTGRAFFENRPLDWLRELLR